MRQPLLSTLAGFALFTASSALAQTTAPGTTAPGAGAIGESGTSRADWLWLIILVLLVAAAIWYFTKGRRRA